MDDEWNDAPPEKLRPITACEATTPFPRLTAAPPRARAAWAVWLENKSDARTSIHSESGFDMGHLTILMIIVGAVPTPGDLAGSTGPLWCGPAFCTFAPVH